MKTKRYKGKTKNKRNKKTRTRGGSSLLKSFDNKYTVVKPKPSLGIYKSVDTFVNATTDLVAAGAESSASIIRGASETTKKIGDAVELVGHFTGKTVIRTVGATNLTTNGAFGAITLLGKAGRLLYVASSTAITGLTRLIESKNDALVIIREQCNTAIMSEGQEVASVGTQDCMIKYQEYFKDFIKDTTKSIDGLLSLMQLSLNVKKIQVKALMDAIGCTKRRKWSGIIGPKLYKCDDIPGVLKSKELSGHVLVKFNNDKYSYMYKHERGATGSTIHLVGEYTRLKKLQDTLQDSYQLKVANFQKEANDITGKLSKMHKEDPLIIVDRLISEFQDKNHCEKIYANLVSEFETPFNNFCVLLVQIINHQGQIRFDTENERLLLEEMDKIQKIAETDKGDLSTQINGLLNKDYEEREKQAIFDEKEEFLENVKSKPVKLALLNKALENQKFQENVKSKPVNIHKHEVDLNNQEASNEIHGGGKTMKNIYNEAMNKYNKAVKKAKNISNYVFGDTTSQKPVYHIHTTGNPEQLALLEKNRRNAEATKQALISNGKGVTTVKHNGSIWNSENKKIERHNALRREVFAKALSNKQKIEQNSKNRTSRLTSSGHNIDTAYGPIKGISPINPKETLSPFHVNTIVPPLN
jgi:hypothetical protein